MNRPATTVVVVVLLILVALWTLRSVEQRVAAALENQRLLNAELRAVMERNGIRAVAQADAHRYLAVEKQGADYAAAASAGTRGKLTNNRPPPHAEYINPEASRRAAESGKPASDRKEADAKHEDKKAPSPAGDVPHGGAPVVVEPVVEEPPLASADGPPRDRDGRIIIAPEDRRDTDDGNDAEDGEEAHEDPVRLTPAPPPPRPALPTLPEGKSWPEGDPNFGFHADNDLPTIGVVTLNAQAGASRGIGLARKSAWIHRMSYTNKQAYCKRWGYDLIIEDNSIIDTSRDVAWSKIPIFKKWLPKYQWLLWIDMDAFFMRFDLPITDLIDNNHDLIIAKDWHGINFGVFLIRNSPWAFHLLDRMWNSPRQWWKPWEEQSALMALTNPRKNPSHAEKLLQHIRFPRQREINAYGAEFAYGNLQALYRAGDRIVHFPNCKAIRTCRNTIESFYKQMLADNGIEDMDANEVPASQYPETRAPAPPK